MAANSWSFGIFKPRYAVFGDRVVIARNVWMPFVLLAIGVPGLWCLIQALSTPRHFDGTMFGLGACGTMLGFFAAVMTPWFSPGQIVFTREGVRWGDKTIPLQAIAKVMTRTVAIRSSQYGKYLSWSLLVALKTGKPLSLSLGNHGVGTSTEPVTNLERSIVNLFMGR
jgi:hypothetical protein